MYRLFCAPLDDCFIEWDILDEYSTLDEAVQSFKREVAYDLARNKNYIYRIVKMD